MASPIEFETCSPTDPDAASLILELNAYLDDIYDPGDNHFRLDPEEVGERRGVFVVARVDGLPVGCGAVRLTSDGRAEVKRMYVRPGRQGQGLGRAILHNLEEHARSLGATGLLLEMGDSQPHARALYESFGFRPVPCWGEYLGTPSSVCLGKDL